MTTRLRRLKLPPANDKKCCPENSSQSRSNTEEIKRSNIGNPFAQPTHLQSRAAARLI
jgi:hypothetical protein